MEKITMETLKNGGAIKLSHKVLHQLDDSLIHPGAIHNIAEVVDALDGSKVEIYVVPYDDNSGAFLQLRCGEHESVRLHEHYLSDVIALAPFIAACAGAADATPAISPDEMSALTERLQKLGELENELTELKRRVKSLEKLIHDDEEGTPDGDDEENTPET